MNPIHPYSVWLYGDYGAVAVIHSIVSDDGDWEITFVDRSKDTHVIKIKPGEWMHTASFVCELDELDQI